MIYSNRRRLNEVVIPFNGEVLGKVKTEQGYEGTKKTENN